MMEPKEIDLDQLKQFFHLEELPIEGGLYTQTYKSPETLPRQVLPARYPSDRMFGTAIVYLLDGTPDCFSAMHRLPTDEIYHFYLGDPVEMLQLYPDGRSERVILGPDILGGQHVQYVAPQGVWQGSHLREGSRFALIGTTMAPGYADDDYEPGDRDELIRAYPQEAGLIRQLTRLKQG